MLTARFVTGVLAIAVVDFAANKVCGQDYPNNPIRIYTTAAGGGSDFTAGLVGSGDVRHRPACHRRKPTQWHHRCGDCGEGTSGRL